MSADRRVVVTGMGLISPLGNSHQDLWERICNGSSGVKPFSRIPATELPANFGGEAREFTGHIDEFGELEKMQKRSIKKGLKLMCREIEMGVAAAQLALQDANLPLGSYEPERIGTLYGCDYIMTVPEEFVDGMGHCLSDQRDFAFEKWGEHGLPNVDPLWLLKYLPNMPASHVAIYNDLRGPSNSLTMREASSNIAIAEAVTTIRRGTADIMLAGATGTRIHAVRSVHVALQEQLANGSFQPHEACRPFDKDRSGMVLGEGAGILVLEALESAEQRSAEIFAEVVGYCTSTVVNQQCVADYQQAFTNVLSGALRSANLSPKDIGHIQAHGLSTQQMDRSESLAIEDVFGDAQTPVTAAKSYMGNLGAGSGTVESIAGIKALNGNRLFPVLNCSDVDPGCQIRVVQESTDPGNSFINVNTSPQGQASAIVFRRFE